jgi:hypothetical protein
MNISCTSIDEAWGVSSLKDIKNDRNLVQTCETINGDKNNKGLVLNISDPAVLRILSKYNHEYLSEYVETLIAQNAERPPALDQNLQFLLIALFILFLVDLLIRHRYR